MYSKMTLIIEYMLELNLNKSFSMIILFSLVITVNGQIVLGWGFFCGADPLLFCWDDRMSCMDLPEFSNETLTPVQIPQMCPTQQIKN